MDRGFLRGSKPSRVKIVESGYPWIILEEGIELSAFYTGTSLPQEAFERLWVRPTALTAADFDEDGMPDLVAGYAGPAGGLVAVHRGNVDFLWPNSIEAQARKAAGQFTDAPFRPEVRVFELPEPPDFLGAGDFDADGHADVIAAARGGQRLYWLRGNGRGGVRELQTLDLPGSVTALAVGEIHRADGLEDIAIGITGPEGSQVLIFAGPDGALREGPERLPVPEEAAALALGQLDEHYAFDLAVAAGHQVLIVYGRDRYASSPEVTLSPRVDSLSLPVQVLALALGDFLWDEEHRTEIAVVGADGIVRVLARTSSSEARTESWRMVASPFGEEVSVGISSRLPERSYRLVRAKVSGAPTDDLILLAPESRRVSLLANAASIAESAANSSRDALPASVRTVLEADGAIVAVLPMRLNRDALSDLVVLYEGASAPVVFVTASHATFVVNDTGDAPDANPGNGTCATSTGVCTLRAAIQEANAHPGPDTIEFNIPGPGPHTISPTSALPTIIQLVTIDATMENACGQPRCVELNGASAGANVDGLSISAGNSVVRGLAINRFRRYGIRLSISGGNIIEGNFIGTDVSGTSDLGNTNDGVRIETSNNTIGGTVASARNVISGNNNDGVEINGSAASGNLVQGNFIGTDASGTTDLGNDVDGVRITGAPGNTIGGTASGARNVISGNNNDGVEINAAGGNLVQGNFIGTDAAGTGALGNSAHGVRVSSASNNTIGGAGAGNVIAFNGGDGVFIASGTGNRIQQNSIFSNTGLGIDLGPDGVTPNDAGDPDTGANNRQNFPVLTSVFSGSGTTFIQGSIDSTTANSAYPILIEFFYSPSCDPSGHGEGQTFFGSTSVSGPGSFSVTLPVPVPTGQQVTATATDNNGNTSEFSACVTVQPAARLIVRKEMVGGTATFTFTGTPSGTISVDGGTLTAEVVPGTYASTEGAVSGWDLVSISCSDSDSTGNVGTRTATFVAGAGEVITCTFRNVKRGRIVVSKDVVPDDGSSWVMSVTGQPAQTIGDGGSATFSDLVPGVYTVSESGPSGYASEVNCGAEGSGVGTSITVTVDPGETITCAFTNRRFGRIVVRKEAVGGDGAFGFTGSGDGMSNFTIVTSGGSGVQTFDNLVPGGAGGSRSVTESGIPSGWDLVSVSCGSALGTSTVVVSGATATVSALGAGDTVTCTFRNVKRGRIVVRKVTEPNPDPTNTQFSFTGAVTGSLRNGETLTRDNLVPGTYVVTEAVPSQFELVSISCDDGASPQPSSGDVSQARATFRVDPGETVTCTFTNRLKRASLVGITFRIQSEAARGVAAHAAAEGTRGVIVVDAVQDQMRVFLNSGDGTLRPGQRVLVGREPVAAAAGDLNGDGATDVVTADFQSQTLTILEGVGDGTFRRGRALLVPAKPVAVAVGDFDRDGRADIVVIYPDESELQIFRGRGDLTFVAGQRVHVGRRPVALAVADLSGEGIVDVAIADAASDSVAVLLGRGDGTFVMGGEVTVDREPVTIAAADLDEDGRVDVVTANVRASTLSIVRNEGMAGSRLRLRVVATVPTAEQPVAVVIGRFFSDGVGIASAGSLAQQVWVHVREDSGRWGSRQRMNINAVPTGVVAVDLDDDGRLDLVVLDVTGSALQVWLNSETGTFRRRQ